MASEHIPLVDLSRTLEPGPARDLVVETIGVACRDIGFLIITGHGVPEPVLRNIEGTARQFFSLPQEEKMRSRTTSGFRGYAPAGHDALARSRNVRTPPDLCEFFAVNRFDDPEAARRAGLRQGRELFFSPNIWPRSPAGFRAAFEAYYAAMENLADQLIRLMALALGLEEDWFESKIREHVSNLTVNHYPALSASVEPGQLRRGAHSDWGSLTILYHDGAPGLQVRLPADDWIDVPAVPGSLVVNLGDLMAAWTNDRWVSTLHRVVIPQDHHEDRFSIAFFHQPAYDALIECLPTCTAPGNPPRHRPVTSGEWIQSMLDKTIY
jgi:isopenicillin N synthase-like dioxygenase